MSKFYIEAEILLEERYLSLRDQVVWVDQRLLQLSGQNLREHQKKNFRDRVRKFHLSQQVFIKGKEGGNVIFKLHVF